MLGRQLEKISLVNLRLVRAAATSSNRSSVSVSSEWGCNLCDISHMSGPSQLSKHQAGRRHTKAVLRSHGALPETATGHSGTAQSPKHSVVWACSLCNIAKRVGPPGEEEAHQRGRRHR